jgi:hypothetical protein
MTWWQAKTLARAGRPVRRIAWGNAKRLVYSVDNPGGAPAIAVLELIDAAGVVTRRVVRAADFPAADFVAIDFQEVGL